MKDKTPDSDALWKDFKDADSKKSASPEQCVYCTIAMKFLQCGVKNLLFFNGFNKVNVPLRHCPNCGRKLTEEGKTWSSA